MDAFLSCLSTIITIILFINVILIIISFEFDPQYYIAAVIVFCGTFMQAAVYIFLRLNLHHRYHRTYLSSRHHHHQGHHIHPQGSERHPLLSDIDNIWNDRDLGGFYLDVYSRSSMHTCLWRH